MIPELRKGPLENEYPDVPCLLYLLTFYYIVGIAKMVLRYLSTGLRKH